MELTCPICGKVFVKRNARQKFCCIQCKRHHDHEMIKQERAAHPVMVKCAVCGKVFRKDQNHKSYCSNKCRVLRDRQYEKSYRAAHRQQRFVTCAACGKVFEAKATNCKYCALCRYKRRADRRMSKESRLLAFGLTEAEMNAVIYDQDIRPFEERYEASKLWTPKQRKFALERYNLKHGLGTVYHFN